MGKFHFFDTLCRNRKCTHSHVRAPVVDGLQGTYEIVLMIVELVTERLGNRLPEFNRDPNPVSRFILERKGRRLSHRHGQPLLRRNRIR